MTNGDNGRKNALEIYLSLKPINPVSNTTIYSNIDNVFVELADYKQALEMYNTALELLRLHDSSFIKDDLGLALIYNNIGGCYNQNGQYNRSIENYEKSISIKLKYLPSNHPSFGITYSNLSDTCRTNGNYKIALKYCQKTVDIHLLTLPKDHIDLAKLYNAMANIYIVSENSIKAKKNDELALEIVLNQMEQKHPLLTTIYNNIATICLNEYQYELTIKYFKCAFDEIGSSDTIGHAVIYNNLGEIYRKTGAEAIYEGIYSQHSLANTSEIATTFNNIGALYQLNGEYKLTRENYENSLVFDLTSLSGNHPNIIQTKQQISLIDALL
ncbi:unnamed protein product [Didymodactylos carnosus]|uniref:Uncharacterized protein n=1 Tax=Didymodactylos carnosus TaxID=1234261 RepID=A0A814S8W4_9BILA|nr:unnamed protein product [Didymodactylos carnosus]CAF3907813.1 unnamed protein product [Didymodactylos carnosus]